MIKKIWRKYSLFRISLVAIVSTIAMACVFDDILDYPSSFFAPEIIHNDKYKMFFRSYHFLYSAPVKERYPSGFNFKESYISDFNNINITEWETYFKNGVKENDLRYILYNSRLGEVDTLIYSLKKPNYPISNTLKSNSILRVTDTRAALDFLYYIGFAKRCEKYFTYEPDDWYYDRSKPDTNDPRNDKTAMAALTNGALKQITNSKSDFVKQRYAFQILRLYYMSGNYDKCIQFYGEQANIWGTNLNSIVYRAMGYAAGAYYAKKQYGTSNYLYSTIYADYDTMKISAYFSFHPQEESDWSKTLVLANTPKEKEVLWQLLGIHHDPLRAMKEIYRLDPRSDLLELLLVRAVNEEEEKFVSQAGEYGEGNDNSEDSLSRIKIGVVNKELADFLKMVADKENTSKPYAWNLACGYINWASGDKGFQKYLDKAKAESGNDSLVKDQIRLIEVLNLVNNAKAGDKKFEESFVTEMTWLDGKHSEDLRITDAKNFIRKNLTEKYALAGDTMIAVCLSGELKKSMPHFKTFLTELMAFFDKSNKTEFEKYAADQLQYNDGDILDMLAIKPFYDYNFKEALDILDRDNFAGLDATLANPFVIHIKDCHDCDMEDANKKVYTKKEFLERMLALEDSVKRNPAHDAKIYFLLANGCYNISYYGNCRILYQTKLTDVEDYFFDSRESADSSEIDNRTGYFSCKKAEGYYRKSLASSKDPEFKAKCYFMIVKCEQNESYNNGNSSGEFSVPEQYDTLKSKYSSTKYYHQIIDECEYFRDYLKQ